jgi:hypothetical protein
MLTLNTNEVHRTLKSIALEAFPDHTDKILSFTLEIVAKEMKSFHGDYHQSLRKLRIFNLSRPTAHIVKTSVHELAHHVDCCLYGKTGHDKQFYTTYKHLLETGHKMGVVDISLVVDVIGMRDIAQLEKIAGRLVFAPQVKQEGWLIKVDNAFKIKDELKQRGYGYSSTERVWLIQCDDSILEDEKGWLHQNIEEEKIRVVPAAENQIDSIYYCIMGKEGMFQHKDALKTDGFTFSGTHGWYKRVLAKDQKALAVELQAKYRVLPKFKGAL